MTKKPFYVSTPIYYVNDKPHLGHAYTTVACDAKARFHRLRGEPTQFLTGTDEHGQKLERAAREAGMDPQAFCDMNSAKFRELWKKLDISYDDYIRTTEERHIRGVQELWRRVEAAGDIYLGTYAGWYAVRDEAFYTESELTEAPGGVKLGPTGAEVEWVEEPSYFFRLSKFAEPLLEHYEKYPQFVQPDTRRNEVMSFVRGGLKDLSLSRTSFQWGIPVPGDEKHVIYVWFDALSNYLTAPGFDENGVREGSPWPTDQHFIGKDILRFHAVYWPAFLLSAGVPLPGQVFSHGWWTVEGQKMSKSLGNAVDPHWLIEEYGVDAIRYFLLKEIPFGLDGDFSHNALIDRINSDLANDLGNLLHRTLNMVKRYREGRLERSPIGRFRNGERLLRIRRRGGREIRARHVGHPLPARLEGRLGGDFLHQQIYRLERPLGARERGRRGPPVFGALARRGGDSRRRGDDISHHARLRAEDSGATRPGRGLDERPLRRVARHARTAG